MDIEEVKRKLRKACDEAGSVAVWSKANGFSKSHVFDILAGKKTPGKAFLDCMHLVRVIRYEPIAMRESPNACRIVDDGRRPQ